ncbi:MAG: hypothetical protein HY040_23525 [Planctomycetes bacterium]|nr:hypothetical protein [Planctomycetota bacterium]
MRRTRVDGNADKIRAFFTIGRKSLRQCRGRMLYRSAESAAAQVGLNAENYRKARQLADPEMGYTREELDDFLNQCRRARYAVGRSFLIVLLRAPKKDRPWFQRRMFEDRWSIVRLKREVLRRYGRRRQGGRARRLPEDVDGLMVMIEGICEEWRRWHWEATEGRKSRARRTVGLEDLPEDVKSAVASATRSMRRLQETVAERLGLSGSERRR